jgi:F420-non-reducing hydrogenase iron-sulfur subunit
LEKERLRLEWISAAEGQRFANVITEFVQEVKKVGPSPLRNQNAK